MRQVAIAAMRSVFALFTSLVFFVESATIPSKSSRSLLLNTNAIAFRSNATESAIVGAEVYIHRRDQSGFRLAQFISVEDGPPFALMAFPTSFGISMVHNGGIVDMSFDFNLDREGTRSVTYYSEKLKQTVYLPPLPLDFSSTPVAPKLKLPNSELRRRQKNERDQIQQQIQAQAQEQQHHHYANHITSPDTHHTASDLIYTRSSTVSVTLLDTCGNPLHSLPDDALELSCTLVRYAHAHGAADPANPYRSAPKWLWRARSTQRMSHTTPGVFTGICDTTALVAAAAVHSSCAARLRSGTPSHPGDGFDALCAPLGGVIDALRDVRYTVGHVYGGQHVALAGFLLKAAPAFEAYERACALFRSDEVRPRVEMLLAAEECGPPPEIAVEVRGKGVSRMLGSMGANQDWLDATVIVSTATPAGGRPAPTGSSQTPIALCDGAGP